MPEPQPDNVTERVIRVISTTQHLPLEKVTADSTFEELGIDSLDGINILFGLENEFDINIPDDGIKALRSVRDVVEGVRKLVDQKA
jgi:acyl carrier protein